MNNNDAYDDNNIYPAADDYDGLLPPPGWEWPSRQQIELENDARYIGGHFRNIAARPWEPWFLISHAGRSLVRLANKRRPERLPARNRDALIADLLFGRLGLFEGLSAGDADLERMLSEAFDGAIVLANYLTESDEERAARHPHVVLDASDRLMIAVSAARAHCLAEDIRRRADQRITDEVAATVAKALEAAGKAAA